MDISFQHVVDIRDFENLFSDAMALGCGSYDGTYLRAALDAGQPDAARPVLDWLRRTGLDDARLAPDMVAVQKALKPR